MTNLLNDNKKYKLVYAIVAMILAAIVSCVAGYDYRISLINSSETVLASYGELLIAIVLTISGTAVLICKNVRINLAVCVVLIILQLGTFWFCEKYEMSISISIFKWFSILIAPFTLLLIEPKKENNVMVNNIIYRIESIIISIFGVLLTFSGIFSLFQSGVLYAEKSYFSHDIRTETVFFILGIVMLVNGSLFMFFKSGHIKLAVFLLMISTLTVSSIFLIFLGAAEIPSLMFYLVIMNVAAVSEVAITVLNKYK